MVKMVYTTACFYPDERPIRYLAESVFRLKIDLLPYGVGTQGADWLDMKVIKLCKALEHFKTLGYTHVCYSDGIDSFYVRPRHDIELKYEALGNPNFLLSCETHCYPFKELSELFPETDSSWRYPNAGAFIGNIDYLLEMWTKLRAAYSQFPEDKYDQAWIHRAYIDGMLKREDVMLDQDCNIFQNWTGDTESLEAKHGRIFNWQTATSPCILHFPGGYVDPERGREERMEPVWRKLGYAPVS